jgi:serine/threonine protein kinase
MKAEQVRNYKKIRDIGQGGYGRIELVEDLRDHKTYAIKKLPVNVVSPA